MKEFDFQSILGTVGSVRYGDKGPSRVLLSRRMFNDFPVIFFDKDVFLASGITRYKSEFVWYLLNSFGSNTQDAQGQAAMGVSIRCNRSNKNTQVIAQCYWLCLILRQPLNGGEGEPGQWPE